jgi:hypothetical protein
MECILLRAGQSKEFTTFSSGSSALDAQRLRADTAEAERDALKDEVGQAKGEYDRAVNKLAAAEQRIAELKSVLERMLEDDDMPVHWFAQRIDTALNPNPEAESHE